MVIKEIEDIWASANMFNVAPTSITKAGFVDQLASKGRQFALPKNHAAILGKEFINYHSLLVAAREFGVFLTSHDLEFLNVINDLYDCPKTYVERRRSVNKGEPLQIDEPQINIVAGTQPGYLAELLPEVAYKMGFTSRTIMVYSGAPVKVKLFGAVNEVDANLREELIRDIQALGALYGEVRWSQGAQEYLEAWYETCQNEAPTHSRLQDYNTRRILHMIKLSIIMSVSRSSDLLITETDVKTAHMTLVEVEEWMPEIFKEMSTSTDTAVMDDLHTYLLKLYLESGKKPIPEHKLHNFLRTKVPVNKILYVIDTMVRSNMVQELGGKTTKMKLYLPRAHQEFAE